MNMSGNEITTIAVYLPDAPAIPGLTFRKFRGESDYPAMAAVIESSNDADQIEWVTTVEDIARNYAHLSNCDPYQDMLFAEVNGAVIGYNRVRWWKESEGNRIYFHFGFLLPQWRRKGIGRAMLHHGECRLREIAADHPADGPRFLESFAYDTQAGTEALLLGEGYAAIRYEYHMVRPTLDDIPAAPLPLGLEVRPARSEHYRAVWDANQEAFRDHWGYSPATENDYQLWLKDPDFDPSLWQVAWDGDQIAGMVMNFINARENARHNRRRGYTEDICVRRPWRRRGLARALLLRSFQVLRERDCTEAALSVDTENPNGALRLYESVGFRTVKRESTYRKLMEQVQ